MSSNLKGLIAVAASALALATMGILGKIAYRYNVDPLNLVTFRGIIAFATLFLALTLIRGNHTLKIGGEVQRHRDNYQNFGGGGGNFSFVRQTTGLPGNTNTGDAFASFLLGEVQNGSAFFRECSCIASTVISANAAGAL